MNLSVIGVCGGNGVILYPFREFLIANYEPRSIFHTRGNQQWQLNFKVPIYKKEIPGIADVIMGAPDCGHSSILSYSRAKKLSNPKDNNSLILFTQTINKNKPRYFLMENLPKMLDSIDVHQVFPDYRCRIFCKPVSVWGNSQKSRIRLVIVGIREDAPMGLLNQVRLPKETYLPTVELLLKNLGSKDIPELCHVREKDESFIPLYIDNRRKITVKEARILWQTEFKTSRRWKVEGSKMVNQPGVYRVFKEDFPLTVRKQNRQFNPGGYMLSPREIARIQGVPDEFKLWYDPKQHLYCINKARATVAKTPPFQIGDWFYTVLTKLDKLWPKKN